MSGATTELNLATAVDADDNADYLTIALANSLRTVDALFNNITGHTHSGAHQGGPIGTIPASAIPAGSITSAMIVDGTITGTDIAAKTITGGNIADATILTGQLADNSVTSAKIYDGTIATVDIADGAITTAKIGSQQVQSGNYAPASIYAASILQDSSITTAKIAANAVQQALGNYGASTTWSTTATGTWLATPMSVVVSCGGGLLRLEANTSMLHSAGGGVWQVGFGMDSVLQSNQLVLQSGVALQTLPVSLVFYMQPSAGTHTFQFYAINQTAGTLSINSAILSYLYVTEQKR